MSRQLCEFKRGEFLVSSDPARMDLVWIHDYLANESYWAKDLPFQIFQSSIENSLCFGIYQKTAQVGFGRVISDYATFAFLADVFIDDKYRGQGLGKWLVESILAYPELQGLRRWMLFTRDAHGLYEQYGFSPLTHPEKVMELVTK
jgi:GNAT superfamily N-acetyltransferase